MKYVGSKRLGVIGAALGSAAILAAGCRGITGYDYEEVFVGENEPGASDGAGGRPFGYRATPAAADAADGAATDAAARNEATTTSSARDDASDTSKAGDARADAAASDAAGKSSRKSQ